MAIEPKRFKSILDVAASQGRYRLLEHEVYQCLDAAGIAVPRFFALTPAEKVDPAALRGLDTDRVVVKILSPEISHKTDVGGVVKVEAKPGAIEMAAAKMFQEVPERYARLIEARPGHAPKIYQGLQGKTLEDAIRNGIRGALIVEMLRCEGEGFGSELLFGLGHNREFGPVLTMGVGGVDTELLGSACRKGLSVVTGSAAMLDEQAFLRILRPTLAYQRVAGLTRGTKRIAHDDAILRVIRGFRAVCEAFGTESDSWTITELEVNPFGVVGGQLVALDGLLTFCPRVALPMARPIDSLGPMMKPSSIAVIGVSAKGMNMGRIILRNMIAAGFDKSRAYVVRPGSDEIDGVRCVPTIRDLPERVDLFVLGVGADQVVEVLENLVEHDKAVGVIVIAGGMAEKSGGADIETRAKDVVANGRKQGRSLVVNGGNCLGIVSRPGRYHTLFVPTAKLPLRADGKGNVAFVSQSGAYMITRMSKLDWLSPRYAVSTGNQIDLTVSDFLRYMADDKEVRTFAMYSEGFKDGDGLACARAIREIVLSGRDVIFYKAGRTAEGKQATSGHTASLAGDYEVCEAIIREAGAHVTRTFGEFLDLVKISSLMGDRDWNGRRLAALSNAGYEAVGVADSVRGDGWNMTIATLSSATRQRLTDVLTKGKIDVLVDVRNPLDLTPMADDATTEEATRVLLSASEVDLVLCATVPLTPAMATLAEGVPEEQSIRAAGSLVNRLSRLLQESRKPVIVSIDSGVLFDPYAKAFEEKGIPTFRSVDEACRALGLYAEGRNAGRGD